jgi:hypothetical protein
VVTIARLPEAILYIRWIILSALIEEEKQLTPKNKIVRLTLSLSLFLFTLTSLLLNPVSALAMSNHITLPAFEQFSKSVQNGQKDILRGVYIDNIMALPVVQQPSGNASYVSDTDGEATQFRMASQFGNVGLLAHNHLSGKSFSTLVAGQEVRLIYGDGRVEYFIVKEVLSYQALQPDSPYSSFKNLNGNETLTAEQMFKRVYFGDHHLTFQTCIETNGNQSWGRLFVIAVPKEDYSKFDLLNP